jgi:ribokinase
MTAHAANPDAAPSVVFVGSPTQDVVIRHGVARSAAGGAAFISALAARWAGATTGVVARVPSRLPDACARAFGPNGLHRGGLSSHDGTLPGFRIRYDANDNAHYEDWSVALEGTLCAADIPNHWLDSWIHIAGIAADARQQLAVLRALPRDRLRGVSAGTCKAMIEAHPAETLALLNASDVFFLNEEEWSMLCPNGVPDGHQGTVVVTRGRQGATVYNGGHEHTHAAHAATVLDPTGAGDAFCGAYLGALVTGSPTAAVDRALEAASVVVGGTGAEPLIDWVSDRVSGRADDDPTQRETMVSAIAASAQSAAFDFTHTPHLPRDHPLALPTLWIATLHQYGFWSADAREGWTGPMLAPIEGTVRKGSDFIWAAFARAARTDSSALSAERMASEPDLFERICTDDTGVCPVPDVASHRALHVAHGLHMQRHEPAGYRGLLDRINQCDAPIAALLHDLRRQPGFMGDPLAKKANLLAVILTARPERWLAARDPESVQPIVDYHMMRLCLRTGLVRVDDPDLRRRLAARLWVDAAEEEAIRKATSRAIEALVADTGRSVAAIDGLFFSLGRSVCLETVEPDCARCPLQTACLQRTALFQPVFRTTDY